MVWNAMTICDFPFVSYRDFLCTGNIFGTRRLKWHFLKFLVFRHKLDCGFLNFWSDLPYSNIIYAECYWLIATRAYDLHDEILLPGSYDFSMFSCGGSFPRPEELASKMVEVCILGTLSPRCLQGWGKRLVHWQSSCYCVDVTFPEFVLLKLMLLHLISCTCPFQLVNFPLPKSLPTSGRAELPQSHVEHRSMLTEMQDLDLDFPLI